MTSQTEEIMAEEACTTDDYAEIAEAMDTMSFMMGLLSRLYLKEPTQELIDDLRQMRFPYETENDYLDQGYFALTSYLSKHGIDAKDELAIDYARTFLGSGTDSYAAAYPMESIHTGRKRLAMQKARDEVLAIYRAYGLDRSESLKDSEDHIGCELEFLGLLATRCAAALRAGNIDEADNIVKTLKNFMTDHIMNWVPKLTAQMRHFCKTEFYEGLSFITIGYLKETNKFLQEISE
jgi:TorA maturation chaperone TorD